MDLRSSLFLDLLRDDSRLLSGDRWSHPLFAWILLSVIAISIALLLDDPVLVVRLLILALHSHSVDLAGRTAAFQ
jgi:hypothetical protein